MASRAVAPSNFLQPGGGQRGDRRADDASQRRAPDPAARRNTPAIARTDRSCGAEVPSERTLRVLRMADAPRRYRYHIEVAAHYYSVPHRFARAEVAARLTARTVEIFLKGVRIAAHMRMSGNHKHTTVAEHMPSSHRRYAGWTIERIRADARLIGPATVALCELILEHRSHPEQGFRACLGIVRLARPYGTGRLEAAANRAIEIGARTYGSVKSMLDNHLDRPPAQKRATDGTPILHSNIRGPRYYN